MRLLEYYHNTDDIIKEKDNVNHPCHYTYGGYETIDFITHPNVKADFVSGNIIKYVSRAGKKDSSAINEDLKKAEWYVNKKLDSINGSLKEQCNKYIESKNLPLKESIIIKLIACISNIEKNSINSLNRYYDED